MTFRLAPRWRGVATRSPPAAVLGAALILLTGCVQTGGSSASTRTSLSPTASGAPSAHAVMQVATAKAGRTQVDVVKSPSGAAMTTFANPSGAGAPLTFYVLAQKGHWLQVELPRRPNGSTGWINDQEVIVTTLHYRIGVSTERKRLSLYLDGSVISVFPIATGTGGTPTPHGHFYITELIKPTNQGYGPYAYGLSAYSNVLNSFGGGPGQIGLHGTPDASSIGRAASHGCIRIANSTITQLAKLLPLGTPVDIQ
jgi:lipoprotein-anchoring transpeptidase ErfK/SrfK